MTRSAFIFCLAFLAACRPAPQTPTPVPTLDPVVLQGKTVFAQNCASCHATVQGTVIQGPSLAGIAHRAGERIPGVDAETYIRDSILFPFDYLVEGYTEMMPTDFGTRLSGGEFDAVVAYLLTLK